MAGNSRFSQDFRNDFFLDLPSPEESDLSFASND